MNTVLKDINSIRTNPPSLNKQFEVMKTALTRFKGQEGFVKDIETYLSFLNTAKPVGAVVQNSILNIIAEKQLELFEQGTPFSAFAEKKELEARGNLYVDGFSKIEQICDEGASTANDVINKVMFNKNDKDKKNRKNILDASLKQVGMAHREIDGDNFICVVFVDRAYEKEVIKPVVVVKSKYRGDQNLDELKQAFDLFDVNNIGRIDPKECVSAMRSLGYDVKNPSLYQIMVELDTAKYSKTLVDWDSFVDHITFNVENTGSEFGLRRIFNLFIDDPSQDTITLSTLKRICRELGENYSVDELSEMISRASGSGTEISFEEFSQFMVNKYGELLVR